MREVERPDGARVQFEYDAFARRTAKRVVGEDGQTRSECGYVWDGPVVLHELDSAEGLTTWHWAPGTFTPLAKERDGRRWTLAADHLGTPTEMYDELGQLVWKMQLDVFGVPTFGEGSPEDCPWRWPGQYEDRETGLSYNRFRYFEAGRCGYLSQDPIGFAGGAQFYGYVPDPTRFADPFGLEKEVCSASGATISVAQQLLDDSEGAPGPGTNVGHSRDHVPRPGQDPSALAEGRPNKANTTVYRNERQALQDLRNALLADADKFDSLPVGGMHGREYPTSGPRQGFNSRNGESATEVTFDKITVRIVRMPNGRLHLLHFSPKITA